MAEPITRTRPTQQTGAWWEDFEEVGSGYAESSGRPSGPAPATYTGTPFSSGARPPSPKQTAAASPPFYSEFLAAKPGGASPRFHDYHLESIERGLKQAIKIKTLRVQLLELKKKAAEAKKAEPKRRRPQPVWAI